MKEISVHIGKQIRFYRKKAGMTIETLAARIQKSKATVSKYENGEIALDIETLAFIAQTLQVSVEQLMEYDTVKQDDAWSAKKSRKRTRLYLYYYNGRQGRIIQSAIDLQADLHESTAKAQLYLDVESFDACHSCKYLYSGSMRRLDACTDFLFENQSNGVERIFMYAINSFDQTGKMSGLLCGITTQPLLPVAMKFILSPQELALTEELEKELVFQKDEIKTIRRTNMFMLGTGM